MMRERKQKCGNFTVIAGNLEGLDTFKFPLELKDWPHIRMVLDSKHETADVIITVTAELSMCDVNMFSKTSLV